MKNFNTTFNSIKWFTISCFLAVLSLSAGCGFVFYDDSPSCVPDREYCSPVCQTYCDWVSCWDECYEECYIQPGYCQNTVADTSSTKPEGETTTTTTTTTTEEEIVCEGENCRACFNDHDCQKGEICLSGTCTARDTKKRGQAGLCQTCETSQDCFEPGAKCLQINYNRDTHAGAKVCGRSCSTTQDCPGGFECVKTSMDADSSSQCIPILVNQTRSCSSSGNALECVQASDCGAGKSCRNNKCVDPPKQKCTKNDECSKDQICSSGECVDSSSVLQCTTAAQCKPDEACINGRCEATPKACIYNNECPQGGRCVNGQCQNACSSDSECSSNQQCHLGLCAPVECRLSADCGMGKICVNASCIDTCVDNQSCGKGYICNSHKYCEPDPNVECRSSAECTSKETCYQPTNTCETLCSCNQDCSIDQVCDISNKICKPAPNKTRPIACTSTCDCPKGLQCTRGGVCK